MVGVPIEVLVGASVIAGLALLAALFLAERASSRRAARRRATAPARRTTAPVPPPRRPVDVVEPAGPIPFAEPGTRGRLFQYGGDAPGLPVDAPFAVVAVETTGLSPAAGDRIVELAVVRVDASGRVEDEYATLLDPGRDVGPVFVHGISPSEVLGAPTFGDVAGALLARLDGAVVVAHNAAVVERFLAAELARIEVAGPPHDARPRPPAGHPRPRRRPAGRAGAHRPRRRPHRSGAPAAPAGGARRAAAVPDRPAPHARARDEGRSQDPVR
jgi:DNA polymerase III subunit epsilon